MAKQIPMPPAPGMALPNPIMQPTPFGPANTGPVPPPPSGIDQGAATLAAHGAVTRADGTIRVKGLKEQPMGVVKIAQAMFSPNVTSLPPVKPLTAAIAGMGIAPAMDNSGAWGQPPNKKGR
jgi:hypothetical protein